MTIRPTSRIGWLLAIFCLLLGAQPADAYLDPGAGSYLIQLLVAGVLGLSFTVKLYWKKIAAFWSGLFRSNKKENAGDA